MHIRHARPRRAALGALIGAAALAASAIAPASAPTAAAAGTGTMEPAIGIHPQFQAVARAAAATRGMTFACQTTQPADCYGPAQIRAAYGIDQLAEQGLDGAGRTIVIVDAYSSPTITQDLSVFDSLFGLPDPRLDIIAPQGLTAFDPTDPTQLGWAGEITLDVEWAHAIAPEATIKLVLAASSQDADILAATRYAVDHDLGDVISQSFGEAEQCMNRNLLAREHGVFAKATSEGITVLASAGDSGAAQQTCDGSSYFEAASTPATDPFVTAVGGTRLDANGITGAYQSESVWNGEYGAGGGGYSVLYPTPTYQRSLHLASRGVPDVSYNAAVMGGVLGVWTYPGVGQLVIRFGGTSAGSPQWAGIVALADQLHHGRLGEINPSLYAAARNRQAYANDFHDVTVGNNGVPPITAGFDAAPGWDAASGLGTPRADQLVPMLAHRVLVGGRGSR